MGTMSLATLLKYLWGVLIPIGIKVWGMMDKRFIEIEDHLDELEKTMAEDRADIKVLVERSAKQEKDFDEIKALIMTLIRTDNK